MLGSGRPRRRNCPARTEPDRAFVGGETGGGLHRTRSLGAALPITLPGRERPPGSISGHGARTLGCHREGAVDRKFEWVVATVMLVVVLAGFVVIEVIARTA